MLFLLAFLIYVLPSEAVNITAVGSPTYFPFIKAWAEAYSLLNPNFNLNFEPSTSGAAGIAQLVNGTDAAGNVVGNKSIDFVLADGTPPSSTQYQVGLQALPMLITTFVAQINLNLKKDILLNGSVLADIFMGKITNWADPQIAATNPNLSLPNATIRVFYRRDVTPATLLWTGALSRWSPTWLATYGGANSTFPLALRNNTNFYGYSDLLSLNGAVAGTVYSIGYVQYYSVKRDPGLHYSHLYNKCSGKETTAANIAEHAIKLNSRLESTSLIDPPGNTSWPIVATVGLVVPTKPSDCTKAREVYKFLRWALTTQNPRRTTTQLGCIPLTTNLTNEVLAALEKIQCNGESIATVEINESRKPLEYFIFTISLIVLFLALILSAIHIYSFRHSILLLIYTITFVLGTLLTLISPILWWLHPNYPIICQTRIWTLSLGFSIMLGTMFSRTWQLQEIYYLQRGGLDKIKEISTDKIYVQLALTLFGVVFVNLIILSAWSTSDPLYSVFRIADEVQLIGYWTCESNNITPWLVTELIFFLILLCFGIYVIYDTWSFQRSIVVAETRWVLFALYNVILNIVAIAPFISLGNLDDSILSCIVILSIDLSAGSIAGSMLLPRIIHNLKWNSTSKNTTNMGSNNGQHLKNGNSKRRHSRTSEEEPTQKLEEPRRVHGFQVEISPTISSKDRLQELNPEEGKIDSPSLLTHFRSIHDQEQKNTPEIESNSLEGLNTPMEGLNTPMEGLNTPMEGLNTPKSEHKLNIQQDSLQWLEENSRKESQGTP